ncbi:PAS domain S-box protein, partial [Pseudomonas sp. 2822-17]|uniref:PAS domain S-box protein n=1 Tax=Pseudomonas sp. 2822-17 TaxID=1712678 RepID=UPI00117A8A3B
DEVAATVTIDNDKYNMSEADTNLASNTKKSNFPNVDLAKETQLLYGSLFENNSDGILVVDYAGNLIDGNPAICELSGYTLDELKKNGLN